MRRSPEGHRLRVGFRPACCLLLAGLCSGCLFVSGESPEEQRTPRVQPTEAAVIVLAQKAPLHQLKELEELKFELESALTSVGGLRVRSHSGGSLAVPIEESMAPPEGESHTLSFPHFENPCSTVTVAILDFRPYRPMHLAAEITVSNPWTGQQTHINGVWHAQADTAQLADADGRLRRELKHMPSRAVLEQESLVQTSPRAFLRAVAAQITPSIRAACLPPGVRLRNSLR